MQPSGEMVVKDMSFSSKLLYIVTCGKVSHKVTNARGREYDYSNHDHHSLYVKKYILMSLMQPKFTYKLFGKIITEADIQFNILSRHCCSNYFADAYCKM